jgi:D-alanine-D-alanine ligase
MAQLAHLAAPSGAAPRRTFVVRHDSNGLWSARDLDGLIEGDARHCRLRDGQFDCVTILGNSFGYFDKVDGDATLLRRAQKLLRPGGRLALDLVDGDWLRENFEKQSWEWLDERLLVCRERSLSRDGDRLITREIVIDADRGVIADRFFAERLYSRSSITSLLEEIGFKAIRFAEAAQCRSDRDTDLGMMARRLLVTSRAVQDPPLFRARKFRNVAVVMGDPRLSDSVKPDGCFGDSDLRTAAALRAALSELPGYRFDYIDDHAALLSRLQASPPDLVLNLCDEGFRNDPTMEAHVPALLEVLGIPYTGAGPGCLTTCYDKAVVRALALALGVPVPDEVCIAPDDPLTTVSALFPYLIKPCLGDNSVGIDHRSVVDTPAAALDVLRRLQHDLPGRPLLMQEYLCGAEYSVGVIGNPGQKFQILPILEVDYSALDATLPKILAYASKWDPQSPYARQIRYKQARLPDEIKQRLADYAARLCSRLGCHDYARFDFRADRNGEIKLLEVNPNPGWCWDGKLNMMIGFAGLRYPDLLRLILDAAQRRIGARTRPARVGQVELLRRGMC